MVLPAFRFKCRRMERSPTPTEAAKGRSRLSEAEAAMKALELLWIAATKLLLAK